MGVKAIGYSYMATNGPKGKGRKGEVKKRTQALNPRNQRWTKKGADGKFMDQMAHRGVAFKGVRKSR